MADPTVCTKSQNMHWTEERNSRPDLYPFICPLRTEQKKFLIIYIKWKLCEEILRTDGVSNYKK
jgi:hypothetical protein